jgi:hypothetical protein
MTKWWARSTKPSTPSTNGSELTLSLRLLHPDPRHSSGGGLFCEEASGGQGGKGKRGTICKWFPSSPFPPGPPNPHLPSQTLWVASRGLSGMGMFPLFLVFFKNNPRFGAGGAAGCLEVPATFSNCKRALTVGLSRALCGYNHGRLKCHRRFFERNHAGRIKRGTLTRPL